MTRVVSAILATVCWASVASAEPLDWLGYDSRSGGAGGGSAGVAVATGVGALHSNPSLLVDVSDRVHMGYLIFCPMLDIELMERPTGANIPLSYYDASVPGLREGGDRPLPTVELANPRSDSSVRAPRHALILSAASSFGLEDFRFALLVKAPIPELASLRFRFFDEREQYFGNKLHFVRFGEWDEMVLLSVGAAWRPVEWLSVGASLRTSFGLTAQTRTYIPDATAQRYGLSDAEVGMKLRVRPVAGVSFRPWKDFRLGLTYRTQSRVRTDVSAELQLWNYHEASSSDPDSPPELKRITQEFTLVTLYQPHEVALGVGWVADRFFVEANATLGLWSGFEDEHGEQAGFHDTVSLAVGAGWEYLPGLEWLLGGSWIPSPVPPQTGRSNYVDGDLWGVTMGHQFRVPAGHRVWVVGAHAQLWRVTQQTVHKDPDAIIDEFPDGSVTSLDGAAMPESEGLQTNNPGFPGYRSGGYGFGGGVSASVEF